MLIGIDMLGVQSPEGCRQEPGRYGRQLVSALMASEPDHRFVLYSHEGLPTDRICSARRALRVPLSPKSGGSARLRPTVQRVIDQNPDGLDWLILLDPFEPNYGGVPPQAPINNSLKVASLILDLAPSFDDDQRLEPLRSHDAILAVSEATASECLRRIGSEPGRVTTLGVGAEVYPRATDPSEPPTRSEARILGRLGITAPFLLANMARRGDRANLGVILDAHQRLPIEFRRTIQLVIAGPVDDPWSVVGYLHEHGCAEGLVLVGELDERTLRTLYGRCAAFLSPMIEEGSSYSIVEAMSCGAAIVAGRTEVLPGIIGDAGLLVDTTKPGEIAGHLFELLSDEERIRALREQARIRSTQFTWEPVIEALLDRLHAEETSTLKTRFRVDRAPVVRPRIALFADVAQVDLTPLDFASQVPSEWRTAYNIDLYFEPGDLTLIERIPIEFGGYDVRQFDRNDGILSYLAVIYHFSDLQGLELKLGRLNSRPGLVFLPEEIDEVEADRALSRLRELFLTTSRVVVRSRRHFDWIVESLPEFVDQLVEIPAIADLPSGLLREQIERCSAELGRRSGSRLRPIPPPTRESPTIVRTRPVSVEMVSTG